MTDRSTTALWSPKLHKWLGVVLLAPLCVWAITGAVFLVKPGYDQAYEKLEIRSYAQPSADNRLSQPLLPENWQQIRRLNSVLGEHLLVQVSDQWQQLDLTTGQSRIASEQDVQKLMEDAFTANSNRYGRIVQLDGLQAVTDTQVIVTLDWDRMALTQRGDDTRLIKTLYRLHYLQWSGNDLFDRVLGFAGLILLIALTALGVRLLFLKKASQ